jgi:hypothetical protein
MRNFSKGEEAFLRILDEFRKIKKYMGITPKEHLLVSSDKVVKKLMDDKVVEKVKLKSFAQKIKGYRFTDEGYRSWKIFLGEVDELPMPTETSNLLRDVFLQARLSWTGEAVTKRQILRHHDKKYLDEVYDLGLVAKVKLKGRNREIIKGYIITNTGYAYLKGHNLM